MESLPLRRLGVGPAPAPDRVAWHALWFGDHNNQRYEELVPRLRRVDPYLLRLPDRRPWRGLGWRAWRSTRSFHDPLLFRALQRRYRSFLVTDFEQLASIERPVVVDVDDAWWSEREAALLNRPNVAAYVVTADWAARPFEELGVEKPWYVVPQGVGLDALDPAAVEAIAAHKRPGEVVVGWVAAFVLADGDPGGGNALYNAEHLLELWDAVHERVPEARLWLIGTAGERLRERLRGRDDVLVLGRLDRAALLARVANFDLAVYPRTKAAGIQAVKIAEFLGLGVPTVAYHYRVTEMLRETGAGVLVRTPSAFVDAVARLLRDPDERGRLAEAARRVGDGLHWSALAARYDEILDRHLP